MLDLSILPRSWVPGAIRDAEAAERLDAEIAKLGSPAGEEPSWSAVREQALAVLRGVPDLSAAAYLSQALLMTEGVDGFAVGLALLRDLLRDRWEDLHPALDRLRARRAVLLWLVERATRSLPAIIPAEALTRCAAAAREAHAECERRFCEPLLGPLRRRLEGALATPAAEPAATAKPTPAPAAGGRAEAVARLAEAAAYFQRSEPHSPIGPLLRRALAWSELGFEDVFRELLARAPEARTSLWETLGLKPEPKRSG